MTNLTHNKKNLLLSIITGILSLGALSSCNVEEWYKDEDNTIAYVLYLDFDTDLPLHKEVYYSRSGEESRAVDPNYDIRYLVHVYSVSSETDDNRNIIGKYVFTRSFSDDPDYMAILLLKEGKYKFRVWADYVDAGSTKDKFYLTSQLNEIKIDESGAHPGYNERRDAFRGEAYGEVYDPDFYEVVHGKMPENSITVPMVRPMGRYEFISTDMDEFLDREARSRGEQAAELLTKGDMTSRDEVADAIELDKYKVVFSYNAFMPSSYNFYTDKPSDSSTGISYEAKMTVGEEGMKLGFDYILVDDQTTMNVNLAIYDPKGNMIAQTAGVEVPIARSKNTIVKSKFLTVTSGGGIVINPGFEGDDFNIELH